MLVKKQGPELALFSDGSLTQKNWFDTAMLCTGAVYFRNSLSASSQ